MDREFRNLIPACRVSFPSRPRGREDSPPRVLWYPESDFSDALKWDTVVTARGQKGGYRKYRTRIFIIPPRLSGVSRSPTISRVKVGKRLVRDQCYQSFSHLHEKFLQVQKKKKVFRRRNVSSVGYNMAGKAGYWLPFYDVVSHGRSVKRIDSALLGLCIGGVAFIGLGIWLETVPALMVFGYFFVGLGIFGMVKIDTALVGLGFLGLAFIGLGIWLESFPELKVPGYVFIGLGIFGMVITFSRFFWHRQNTPKTPDQSN